MPSKCWCSVNLDEETVSHDFFQIICSHKSLVLFFLICRIVFGGIKFAPSSGEMLNC